MLRRTNILLVVVALAVLVAAWAVLVTFLDTDKSGKISKQEWMKFMEGEFDRLDKGKNGLLDVRELTQSQLRVSLWVIKTSSVAENRDARIDRLVVVTARSLGKR